MNPLEAAARAATDSPAGSAVTAGGGLVVPSLAPPGSYLELLAKLPSALLTQRNLLIFHLPRAFGAQGLPHAARVFSQWLFGGDPPYYLPPSPPGHRFDRKGICVGNRRLPVYTVPEEALARSLVATNARWVAIASGTKRIGSLVQEFLSSPKRPCPPPRSGPCPELSFPQWLAASWACLRERLKALPVGASQNFGAVRPAYPELPLASAATTLAASATGPSEGGAIFGRMTLNAYLLGAAQRVSREDVTLSNWEVYLRAFDIFRFDEGTAGRKLGCWSQEEGLLRLSSAGQVLGIGEEDQQCLHDRHLVAFRRDFVPAYNRLAKGSNFRPLMAEDMVVICEDRLKLDHPEVKLKLPMGK